MPMCSSGNLGAEIFLCQRILSILKNVVHILSIFATLKHVVLDEEMILHVCYMDSWISRTNVLIALGSGSREEDVGGMGLDF